MRFIGKLGRQLARTIGRDEGDTVRHLRQRLAVVLLRDNASLLGSRALEDVPAQVSPHSVNFRHDNQKDREKNNFLHSTLLINDQNKMTFGISLLPIKKTDLKFKITDLKQTQSLPKNRPKTDPAAKKRRPLYNISKNNP